jgi:hypothetical protein
MMGTRDADARDEAARDRDEFERISLFADIERDRAMIERYEDGQAFFRTRIEDRKYRIGQLDERLGEAS